MARRVAIILVLLLLSGISCAQKAGVLYPIWNKTLKGDIPDRLNTEHYEITDLDDDGFGEILIVTSASPASGNIKLKNRVYAYLGNGSIFWINGVDNWIREVTTYDIDRDNTIEVLVSMGQTFSGIQRGEMIFFGSNGRVIRKVRDTSIYKTLHISDIDNDRYFEIIGGSSSRSSVFGVGLEKKWIYPPVGTKLFPRDTQKVSSGDLDRFENEEIVLVADQIYVIDSQRYVKSKYNLFSNRPILKRDVKYLEVNDFTSDNYDEILAITHDNVVQVIAVNTSSVEYDSNKIVSYNLTQIWINDIDCDITTVKTVNVDADQFNEILLGCSDRQIILIDNIGHIRWRYYLDGEVMDIFYSDIDQDNIEDIISLSTAGTIYSLNVKGEFLWRQNTLLKPDGLMLGDLTGDRIPEIAIIDEDTAVTVYGLNQSYVVRKTADSLTNLCQEYYWQNEYLDAQKNCLKARELYERINYTTGLRQLERLIQEIKEKQEVEARAEADLFYDKAQESFISGDYVLAVGYLGKAKQMYMEFGDSENILRCELMGLRIKAVIDNEKTGSTLALDTTPTTLPPATQQVNYSLIAGIGVIIILLLLVILKRKDKSESQMLSELDDSSGGDEWGEIDG